MGHGCFWWAPLCTHTPFQYCRSGKPPMLLPEYKMPDRRLEKSSKQRDTLVSKKRETSCVGPNYFCSKITQFWPFSGFQHRAWLEIKEDIIDVHSGVNYIFNAEHRRAKLLYTTHQPSDYVYMQICWTCLSFQLLILYSQLTAIDWFSISFHFHNFSLGEVFILP